MATAVKRAIVLVLSKENIRPLITKEISPKKGIVMAKYIGTLIGHGVKVDSNPVEAINKANAEEILVSRLFKVNPLAVIELSFGILKLEVREDNSTSITA